ncbi:MAG: DKNYY domain-containing protein [bacterium]|nr:DKNYY domain-containing protein [bacterium]
MEDMGKQKKNLLFRGIPDIPHISRRKLFVGILILIVVLIGWGIFTADKHLVGDYYVNDKGEVYAKGDGFVYGDNVLSGVDAETFAIIDNSAYVKDKNAIFVVLRNGAGRWVSRVDDADMSSFVGAGWWFGKDINHVFFKGRVVVGADSSTFSAVGDRGYAKDKQHAFFEDRILSDRPNSLRLILQESNESLSFYHYATDGVQVFLNGDDIKGADPTTFGLPFGRAATLARDSHSIYFNGTKVDGADVESFAVLPMPLYYQSRGYAKDSHHVYFSGYDFKSNPCANKLCVLETADPKTFVLDVTKGHDAKDASHYFYNGNVVTNEE